MKPNERFEVRRRQWLAAVHRRIMRYRKRVRFYSQQLEMFPPAAEPWARLVLEQPIIDARRTEDLNALRGAR